MHTIKLKKYRTNPKRELELKLPATSAMKISGSSLRNFLEIEQLLMYNLHFLKMQLLHSSLPPTCADPKCYQQPAWMPSPATTVADFNEEKISLDEIALAVKKARFKSSPSSFDGIPYAVFKRCSALLPTLRNIFNFCWSHSTVQSAWKLAAVKLIAKSSAEADPSSPTNFRPIALTSCIGKLFSTILRNRWLNYMIINKYFNKSVQKAFMPTTPGCSEHHLKLASILKDAKRKHKSLAICWVDLANAYGSVHHSLIQFSLQHYNAPPKFRKVVESFYTGLYASVSSEMWDTPFIPIQVGVYQGDPLSVVIFNTVINTMVDTVQSRQDLGYIISPSQKPVNLLQYADDTCLVANFPSSCQHLINMLATCTWLSWSGMKAKIPKCASLGLLVSTGKKVDPMLTLEDYPIQYTPEGVRFLGLKIEMPPDHAKSRVAVVSELERMLCKIDRCPLTRKQKLLL